MRNLVEIVASAILLFTLALAAPAIAGELHKAARKGDADLVLELIEAGEPLNELDAVVGAPMHWAAARGHREVAQVLLDEGADFDLEGKAPDFLTPLQLASASGHLDLVKFLTEAGASLTAGVNAAGTPLHLAAYGDHPTVVAFLLETGADPFATAGENYGIYPLHWTAQSKGARATEVLLSEGFPVDEPMTSGTTALHIATFYGHTDVVRTLLAAGANPYAESSYLETPFELSRHSETLRDVFASFGIE